jgi:hypothetical protein
VSVVASAFKYFLLEKNIKLMFFKYFFDNFNVLISKIKNKKNHFDAFSSKKYF